MSESIALLLQRHFIEYCKQEIGDSVGDCRLTYFEYESLEELRRTFQEIRDRYDGFLTSGALPMNVLRGADPPPYAALGFFGGYLENTYRILLTEILGRRTAESGRIGLDYVEDGTDLEEILKEDRLPGLVRAFEEKLVGRSAEELEALERGLAERYVRQCREGKLDLAVTYFHSVAAALAQENVDCHYAYPSRQSLCESIELCAKNIRLEKMRSGMSAVVRVSLEKTSRGGGESAGPGRELAMLKLKSALLEYCKEHRADPVLKDDFGDVEMYLNLEQVRGMTADFKSFDLPLWLKRNLPFDGWVSIGAGEDLNRARFRALQARDYEQKLGKELSVLIDEQDRVLTLPLKERDYEETSGVSVVYVDGVANRAHLSSETVFRVITAVQTAKTEELTAYDLVRLEDFSLRVATRVLAALAQAGFAERVGQKRIGNKGRPQNLYRVCLDGTEESIEKGLDFPALSQKIQRKRSEKEAVNQRWVDT